MLKKVLAVMALLYAAASFAAVDVNKASATELDSIKGIGPGISSKILDERKKGNFKDWNDFVDRVKGIGEGNAAKFSAEGLTVNGATFKGTAPAPAAKKDEKKVESKTVAPAVAASAPAATVDDKTQTKADKKAAQKAKADDKQHKAEVVKPAASAAKK